MRDVRMAPQTSRVKKVLCGALGHSEPVRMVNPADVLRDDGVDHTYAGCAHCGVGLAER